MKKPHKRNTLEPGSKEMLLNLFALLEALNPNLVSLRHRFEMLEVCNDHIHGNNEN